MKERANIESLGEGTLRVNNLCRMKCFYREVLGFAVAGEFPNAALLEIHERGGGHTQVIGLIKRAQCVGRDAGGLDSVVFTLRYEDCESERRRLENLGLKVAVKNHGRMRRRSLYIHDPEGNVIELLCETERLRERNGSS